MRRTGSEGPYVVQVRVAPARAAYLISAGSRTGLRRAMQEATTRWGGMTEPIVPVRSGGRIDGWWRQVLELSRPDGLVNVDLDPALAASIATDVGLPCVPLDLIDHAGYTSLNVYPLGVPDPDPMIPRAVAAAGAPLWQVAAIGGFTAQHADSHGEESGFYMLPPNNIEAVVSAGWQGHSFIARTVVEFSEIETFHGIPVPLPAIIFVTKGGSYADSLAFWNLRALQGLREGPAPMTMAPLGMDWQNLYRTIQGGMTRNGDFEPDLILFSSGASEEYLHSLGNLLGLNPSKSGVRSSMTWPPPRKTAPFTYLVEAEVRNLVFFGRRYGHAGDFETHVAGGRARLRFENPSKTNSLAPLPYRFSSEMLQGLPRRPAVAVALHQHAEWEGGELRLVLGGGSRLQVEIELPSQMECIERILEAAGISFEWSDKGKLAASLLDTVDGRVLHRQGIWPVLQALATPRSKELLRELKKTAETESITRLVELASVWGGRMERRHRTVGQLGLPNLTGPGETLELLCQSGWAERGFETACARCGIRSFTSVSEGSSRIHCPACQAEASLVLAENGTPTLTYRLDPLVDRATDQGAIPHLITMSHLKGLYKSVELLGGIDLLLADGKRGEADILGLLDDQFACGEVKSRSSEFVATQIAHDIELSALVGADVHIMAAMDDIPPPTVAVAERAAKAIGLNLLVVDRSSLSRE
jgi:hypothetical protein